MKAIRLLVVSLVILVCLAFVSCDLALAPEGLEGDPSGSGSGGSSDSSTIERSLSNLVAGGSIELSGIGADTEINLTGFSLEDGIYIEVVGSRDISEGSRDIVSDILFQREDGTIIPIPDEEGNIIFHGRDLGLSQGSRIIIRRLLRLDTDLEISNVEYPDVDGLVEEFYYINPTLMGLDPREIVFVVSGSTGMQGISLLQRGMLKRVNEGVMDCELRGYTGFAVSMFKIISPNRNYRGVKLKVLNPIHMELGAAPTQITTDVNVIRVNEQDDGLPYKVVLTFTGDNAERAIRALAESQISIECLPRYLDGNHCETMVVPEFDLDGKKITYHLGSVDQDFIFTLDYSIDAFQSFLESGSVSAELAVDSEPVSVFDFADFEDEVSINARAGEIVTWAFKSDSNIMLEVNITNNSNKLRTLFHIIDPNGYSNGSIKDVPQEQNTANFSRGSGFIVASHSNGGEHDPVINLQKIYQRGIDCAVVEWDPINLNYVCVDEHCPVCNGNHKTYSHSFVAENSAILFNQTYWTSEEFAGYGRIGLASGAMIVCSENIRFNTGSMGGNSSSPYRSLQWDRNDSSRMVEIRVKRMNFEDGFLVCDISTGGSEVFTENVVMTAHSPHAWEYEDRNGGVACCEQCHIERVAVERHLSAGTYTVQTKGAIIVAVPALSYQKMCNGLLELELQSEADVLFIAPADDYDILMDFSAIGSNLIKGKMLAP